MGLFITFEGVEGSGKTTQTELLKKYLESRGVEVLCVREPGGTAVGERIRSILLNSDGEGLDPWAELFLYEASRAQLVKEVLRPALDRGKTVICDRFTDSTLAYQGYGRGLDLEGVVLINSYAAQGLVPDLTFLLSCPPETGLERALKRIGEAAGDKEDRFEREGLAFHRRVAGGFLEIARRESGRIRVIDARRPASVIHGEICDIIKEAGL